MSNKQTAVEFLFSKLWEQPKDKFTWYNILNKAKEIEKQQIIDSHYAGSQIEDIGQSLVFEAENYFINKFSKK